jgi:AraC-like DNA-binding protein
MIVKKTVYLLFLLIFNIAYPSLKEVNSYKKIRERYENYKENDGKAFPYLNQYIHKAKEEKNYPMLVQGYKDGVFYSSSKENKLKYADSTKWAAQLSGDKDLISIAYLGKGIVYYFNYKKYKPALDEYLKAYEYAETTKNDYLRYKIIYHLGVVKSYLGYYDDALAHFKECIAYFTSKMKQNLHPNEVFNNKRGYYNSLHQMIMCYIYLKDYQKADSLTVSGLNQTGNAEDFLQEKSYFLKCRGILYFHKKKYKEAIESLNGSLPKIISNDDFAWASVDYFYIGKSYLGLTNNEMGIRNFKKVDSIFQKHEFILPELRENYELLINYYKKEKDTKQELMYTKQLLKADSLISQDFSYLSSKIHKEYDTKTLLNEKEKLEKEKSSGIFIIKSLVALMIILLVLLSIRYTREKNIQKKYKLLEEKIRIQQGNKMKPISIDVAIPDAVPELSKEKKQGMPEGVVDDILKKLKIFEEKKLFNQKGLTLNKLASKLGTNAHYLSQVINEYKGTNFNKYLGELRINYITQQLYSNKVYLSYTIESYAEECGIASRQNFSDLFYEINGIRPKDFIRKRKNELEKLESV